MKTLIVTGGTIDLAFALQYVKQQEFDYFIASDAGMHFFEWAHITPQDIVGDFDSADVNELQKFRQDPQVQFHVYNPKKDYVDTELALRLAIDRDSSEIHILGGTGTRLDHVLGTVHVLGLALVQNIPCFLVDAYNRVRLVGAGRIEMKKAEQFGQYVSLIPLTTQVRGVTLSGFLYPLNDGTFDIFRSLGISNEIVQETAVIEITDGIAVLVESADEMVNQI